MPLKKDREKKEEKKDQKLKRVIECGVAEDERMRVKQRLINKLTTISLKGKLRSKA